MNVLKVFLNFGIMLLKKKAMLINFDQYQSGYLAKIGII